LLMNAIKFTPEGGTIWISAEPAPGPASPEVVFRVQDTGVGLAPGQETRIWERFYQAESSSTRRFGGAGLGLSIVRRLTELHGGRVDATSAGPNLGSTFTGHAPAVPRGQAGTPGALVPTPRHQPSRAEESAPTQPATSTGPAVLVVEDDVHIATVLRTYLEADGYRDEVAEDGPAAIDLARTLRPFAITLD